MAESPPLLGNWFPPCQLVLLPDILSYPYGINRHINMGYRMGYRSIEKKNYAIIIYMIAVSCLVLLDRAAAPACRTSPLLVMVLRMRTRTTLSTVLPVPTALVASTTPLAA